MNTSLTFNRYNPLFFLKNPKVILTQIFIKSRRLDTSYKIEIPHNAISEKWNEYLVNDDGTKLKLKSTVTDVKKSNIFLQNGDPIYNVRIKILSKVIRPKI